MKKKSKKIKYINTPLKWNAGLQKFEVDSEEIRKMTNKKIGSSKL